MATIADNSAGKKNEYGRKRQVTPTTDNAVFTRGRLRGFRCTDCGKVDQAMWGDTCNDCRRKEEYSHDVTEAVNGFAEIYEATEECF